MGDDFESFVEQFEALKGDISRAVSALAAGDDDGSSAAREAMKRKSGKARKLIQEAERTIKAMDMEARSVPPSEKRKLTERIRKCRTELNNLKTDLERAQSAGDRDALLTGGARGAVAKESASQRARLEESTARMDKSTAQLEETRRTIMETEEVGVNIMGNLHSQRETLLRAHEKVKETNRLAGRARRVLNSIKRRACTNQLILWFIMILLVGLIGLVIYFGFIHDPKKSS